MRYALLKAQSVRVREVRDDCGGGDFVDHVSVLLLCAGQYPFLVHCVGSRCSDDGRKPAQVAFQTLVPWLAVFGEYVPDHIAAEGSKLDMPGLNAAPELSSRRGLKTRPNTD